MKFTLLGKQFDFGVWFALLIFLVSGLAGSLPSAAQQPITDDLERQLQELDLDSDLDSAIQSYLKKKVVEEEPEAVKEAVSQDDELTERQVLDLSQAMFKLEADLLYPTNTNLNIFLSLAPKASWSPNRVRLRIGGDSLTQHNYKKTEKRRLSKGAIQPLHSGFLSVGEHRLEVEVTSNGKTRRREFRVNKTVNARFVEIVLGGKSPITLRQWD